MNADAAVNWPVVELRQYTLVAGRRDELIDLFERELVEPQEAEGMRVVGTFRDLDDPHRFVWLRAFRDMKLRRRSLAAFYGGPVWQQHRDAANATMVDSDNVLLLRAARPGSEFTLAPPVHPVDSARVLVAVASVVTAAGEQETLERFEAIGLTELAAAALTVLGYFVTEPTRNTFPALPVREGERVVVCVAGLPDEQTSTLGAATRALTDALGRDNVAVRRLQPTASSHLRGSSPACGAVRTDLRTRPRPRS